MLAETETPGEGSWDDELAELDGEGDWSETELSQTAFSRRNGAVSASQTMAQQLSDASTSLAQTSTQTDAHHCAGSAEHKDRKENNCSGNASAEEQALADQIHQCI